MAALRLPKLPRAGWLAVGAIVAALGVDGSSLSLGLPAPIVTAAAVVGLVAAVVWARLGRAAPAALLIGLSSVALRAGLATLISGTGPPGAAGLEPGAGEWQATIADLSSPSGGEQRALVRLVRLDGEPDGSWLVYAWLPRHPAVVPGDVVRVRGQVELPPDDGSGFADFLAGRGAVGTLKSRSMELVEGGGGPLAAVERLRWAIDGALSRVVPEPEAGLGAGILIGLRERVSRQVADDFTITGLTHVVAISGWNIALVAGIATGLLRATGLGRRPRSFLVITAIIGYTVLAGAEASVIRAAAMGGIVLLAREGGRPSGAAAALGVAAWGLLLVEPRMIDDVGLQLSLAATAGLLALGGHAEATVRRVSRSHAPRWVCETLGVSLAAQLATLPLILLHFGRLSLVSPLANLLVAPIVPLAMLGAFVGVLLGPLLVAPAVALLTAPVALLAWLPLALMVRGATLLAGIPLANLELVAPFDLAGAALALLALVLVLRRARQGGPVRESDRPGSADAATASSRHGRPGRASATPRRRARSSAVIAATCLVVVIGTVLIARPASRLQVSVLDIGQGDAILLEAEGGARLLVDGGPDPDLLVRRLDERLPLWDRRIDLVVLSHPHEDHAGGLAGLAPRYHVTRIGETGMASDGSGVRELRLAAERHGMGRNRLLQGDTLRLGAARVDVLWPPPHEVPSVAPSSGRAINDTSVVLGVTLGRQRILLTGDLEEDKDDELIEVLGSDGQRWDVLKVAHHGSATASSAPLLERLRPRISVVSSGIDNSYGHPAPSTLERLRAVSSRIWRTDLQGTFSMSLDGGTRTASGLLSAHRARLPCPALRRKEGATRAAAARAAWDTPTDARGACYARPDGGAHPIRSALAAPVRDAFAPPAPARHGRGRGGLVPGLSGQPGRPARRPSHGRDSRAPP